MKIGDKGYYSFFHLLPPYTAKLCAPCGESEKNQVQGGVGGIINSNTLSLFAGLDEPFVPSF